MNPWWLYRTPRGPPGSHLCPDMDRWVRSPIPDVPVLGPALGSHPAQMDSFHVPACASLCEGEGVSGHRKLQDLCSEEQQGVKLSHDPSWSLKQSSFHGFYSSSLCGIRRAVPVLCWVPQISPCQEGWLEDHRLVFFFALNSCMKIHLTLSWCASISAKVLLVDSCVFPLDHPAYHSLVLLSTIFWV